MKTGRMTKEDAAIEANEMMMHSKGFLLFTVGQGGQLTFVVSFSELNEAEAEGLVSFAGDAREVIEDTVADTDCGGDSDLYD